MASDYDDFDRLRRRVSRYDLLLAVIPAAYLVAAVVGQFLSVPWHVVFGSATVVCALALVDGLFIDPPSPGSGSGTG